MPTETIEAPAQPAVATPESGAENKSGENVGTNQAVARMLKMEQAREAARNAPTDTVPQAEATTEQPVTESAPAETVAETATETEAQATEPTAEPTDALSHEDHSLDPKLQEKIDKRIGKEVAKRKALEAQLNELTLKVQAQAQQPATQPATLVPLPEGAPPLANIEDANGLVALVQQAKEAKRWAETQLDEGTGEVQLGDKILHPKDLKAIIRNANKTLEDDIPQRAQFLQKRAEVQKAAYQEFPFLTDKSSPDYVAAQTARQLMPWLNNLPNADWIIGVQIEGLKSLQSKKASAEKAKAKVAVKSAPPPSSQTAVSSNGNTSRVAQGTRSTQEISAIRNGLSKRGGVSTAQAIAALTKIEQLRTTR